MKHSQKGLSKNHSFEVDTKIGIVEVVGQLLVLPDIIVFLHRRLGSNYVQSLTGTWQCTHLSTGRTIGSGQLRRDAIHDLETKLKKYSLNGGNLPARLKKQEAATKSLHGRLLNAEHTYQEQ